MAIGVDALGKIERVHDDDDGDDFDDDNVMMEADNYSYAESDDDKPSLPVSAVVAVAVVEVAASPARP